MIDPATRTELWTASCEIEHRYKPGDTWHSCSFHWSIESASGQAEYYRSLGAKNVLIRRFKLVDNDELTY